MKKLLPLLLLLALPFALKAQGHTAEYTWFKKQGYSGVTDYTGWGLAGEFNYIDGSSFTGLGIGKTVNHGQHHHIVSLTYQVPFDAPFEAHGVNLKYDYMPLDFLGVSASTFGTYDEEGIDLMLIPQVHVGFKTWVDVGVGYSFLAMNEGTTGAEGLVISGNLFFPIATKALGSRR